MRYWRALSFVTPSNFLTCAVTFSDGSTQQTVTTTAQALNPSVVLSVDFGVSVLVSSVSFLADTEDTWPYYALIQKSSDSVTWETVLIASRIPYPGQSNTQTITLSPVTGLVAETTFFEVYNDGFILYASEFDAAASVALIDLSEPVPATSLFTGVGVISGTVSAVDSPSNTPLSRPVVLLDATMATVINRTMSNQLGNYSFSGLEYDKEYVVISQDTDGVYRPVAADKLKPSIG